MTTKIDNAGMFGQTEVTEKLEEIKHLLIHTVDSIANIKRTVGHAECFRWSEKFKLETGLSPTVFRRRYAPKVTEKGVQTLTGFSTFENCKSLPLNITYTSYLAILSAVVSDICIHGPDGDVQKLPMFGDTIAITPVKRRVEIGPFYINALGRTSRIAFEMVTDQMSNKDAVYVYLVNNTQVDARFELDVIVKINAF